MWFICKKLEWSGFNSHPANLHERKYGYFRNLFFMCKLRPTDAHDVHHNERKTLSFRPNPHCLELVLILGSNWDRFFIKRDQDEFFAFTLYTRNSLENQLTPGITDAHSWGSDRGGYELVLSMKWVYSVYTDSKLKVKLILGLEITPNGVIFEPTIS